MACLSAAVGRGLQPRRRGRLLHLGPADRRHRNDAVGDKPHRHHREDARPRHDDDEDAGLHLDVALHQCADRRHLPGADRDAGAAYARPLCRHELLHQRPRRQSDDVCQPHLDLGPSGGLHPHPAGLRHFLGSRRDLLRQAALRLCLDGLCHGRHHHPLLHRLAAPLLHHGLGCERQRLLRHHDDDHLDPDRSEDVQTGSSPCIAAASATRCLCCGPSVSW